MQPYELLEQRIGAWVGREPELVVVCSSGTAALHLAMECFEGLRGESIYIPDLTMVACARAAALAEMKPVFVDCREDLTINPDLLPDVSDCKALMAVHIYGRRCAMNRLAEYCKSQSMILIEDMAEAHGVAIHPQTDAACYSFYRNKIVHGEEGGCVVFKDIATANRARQLRSLGFTNQHDFMHVPRGHNYRLSNCHASLILESLDRVKVLTQARRYVEEWYEMTVPAIWKMLYRESPWVYDIRLPFKNHHDQYQAVNKLNNQGIAARCCFRRMSEQPEFNQPSNVSPNAERLSREVIYLPLTPGLVYQDVIRSVRLLEEVCRD